jgi:ribonuclease D
MTEVIWQPKILDRSAHRRLSGYGTLTPEQKEHLRRLFRWRFEKARETDRALFMLLTDQQLIALSRLDTVSLDAMNGQGILSPEKIHRFGPELLDLLRNG